MKRFLCLLLCFVFIVTLSLTGCGAKKDNTAGDTATTAAVTSAPETSAAAEDDMAKYYKKYTPAITLSVLRTSPSKSDTPVTKENPWGDFDAQVKWESENIGINWIPKYNWTTDDEKKQKLNIAIVSNDLPDFLLDLDDPATIAKMYNAKEIIPLDDLFEKYASPLTKYLLQEYNDASNGLGLKAVSFGGKYYAVPMILDAVSSAFDQSWIRKDLLTEMGITSAPQNLSELEAAFKAYKAKYPKGVAYTMDNTLNGVNFVASMFGAVKGTWLKDSSDTLVYSSIQPGMKDTLATLNSWYKAGYLDSEFVVKDGNKSYDSFSKDNALVMGNGAYWNPFFPFPDMAKANPKFEAEALGFLKGPSGQALGQVMKSGSTLMYGCAISAKCKNPEAIIYELNWYVDSYFRNHKDLREKFKFKFPETPARAAINPDEVTAGKVGKYDYPADIQGPGFLSKDTSSPNGNGVMGITFQIRAGFDMNALAKAYDLLSNNKSIDELDSASKDWYQLRLKNMQNQQACMNAMAKQLAQRKQYLADKLINLSPYQGISTPTMLSKNVYLDKLELETFTKIIVGQEPVASFDKFVETWKKQGGDQITKEVNDWYTNNK